MMASPHILVHNIPIGNNAVYPLFVAKEAIMKKIAQKRKKVELSGSHCFIGVDVHKTTYYVALLSEEGNCL